MPNGAGRKRRDVVNLESFPRKKDCIVQIKNKDDLCCARAIVVAKSKLDKDPKYKSIVSRTGTLQGRLAQELHESAGVPLGSCCSKTSRGSKKVPSSSSWLSAERDLQGTVKRYDLFRS